MEEKQNWNGGDNDKMSRHAAASTGLKPVWKFRRADSFHSKLDFIRPLILMTRTVSLFSGSGIQRGSAISWLHLIRICLASARVKLRTLDMLF